MPRIPVVAALWSACMMAVAGPSRADPSPGGRLPPIDFEDLDGRSHSTRELHQPTLLIVITGPEARAASQRWILAAERRVHGTSTRVVAIVALSLPFFVPDSVVRARAQSSTARRRWGETWIDTHGTAQRAFGVHGGSTVPWACMIDATGRVVATAHVPVDHADAEPLLAAL